VVSASPDHSCVAGDRTVIFHNKSSANISPLNQLTIGKNVLCDTTYYERNVVFFIFLKMFYVILHTIVFITLCWLPRKAYAAYYHKENECRSFSFLKRWDLIITKVLSIYKLNYTKIHKLVILKVNAFICTMVTKLFT
jgi:hypothetical protein